MVANGFLRLCLSGKLGRVAAHFMLVCLTPAERTVGLRCTRELRHAYCNGLGLVWSLAKWRKPLVEGISFDLPEHVQELFHIKGRQHRSQNRSWDS